MSRKEALFRSYLMSLLYVGFATLCVFSIYPSDSSSGGWVIWGLLITLPVNFFSLAIRYAEPQQFSLVILVQLIVFLITGWIIYRRYFRKRIADDDNQ